MERLLRDTFAAREATTPDGPCLDADTAAAWADDALSSDERAAAIAHAADCARCQALLAAIARTSPPTPATSTSWWRAPRIGWLVPLAGVGAAVTLWMVVPDRPSVRPAERLPSADAVARAPSSPPASPIDAPPPQAKLEQEPGRSAAQDRRESRDEGRKEVGKQAGTEAPTRMNRPAAEEEKRLDSLAARAPAATPAPPSVAESVAIPQAAAAERSSALALARVGDTVIVSSNPGSRWRIVPGGAVQRSADGGSTWQTQQTGVAVTLIAGASPSPSVCWLVGPGGIVLLSTDGQSWRRVAFPEVTDLVQIRAIDDKSATVTASDGRIFVTDDGGVTWTRGPAQDFPTAPF